MPSLLYLLPHNHTRASQTHDDPTRVLSRKRAFLEHKILELLLLLDLELFRQEGPERPRASLQDPAPVLRVGLLLPSTLLPPLRRARRPLHPVQDVLEEELKPVRREGEVVVVVRRDLHGAQEHSRLLEDPRQPPHILPVRDGVLAAVDQQRGDRVGQQIVFGRNLLAVPLLVLRWAKVVLLELVGPHRLRPVQKVAHRGSLRQVAQVDGNSGLVQVRHVRQAEQVSHEPRVKELVVGVAGVLLRVATAEKDVADPGDQGLDDICAHPRAQKRVTQGLHRGKRGNFLQEREVARNLKERRVRAPHEGHGG
mmetsp:Transcript_4829/g.16937  ORF Transcript_4829/g.16937 Transcript_4829/m.16937 type:complete len:310 (-) Transcript_4829:1207-2136(-)